MTSGENGREEASTPDSDGTDLLIGWRADGEKAASEPESNRGAEDHAEAVASAPRRPSAMSAPNDEAGTEAVAVPDPDPAATVAALAAGQQRILALLEDLASKHAAVATGDTGIDLDEAARSIQAATEWVSDIRAAMDALLAATGKSIRELNQAEQGLGAEAAALKARAEGIDGQIAALRSGAQALGAQLRQLDEARQKLDARSAELQAVKQEIAKYYGEWTAAALTYRREMATLSKRLDEGENLVARVEKAIDPWTARIEKGLDENAEAQKRAAAETSGNVRELTESGSAFLEKFGTAWNEALADFRTEWRRTRRWSVPVLAAVLAVMVPVLPVMGALGQSQFGIFAPHDDLGGWRKSFWMRHGDQVRACAAEAMRTTGAVPCRIDVTAP